MTLTKQALSEALAYGEQTHYDNWAYVQLLANAARFVERLLPEKCEDCDGTGWLHDPKREYPGDPCHICHGSGQLWDEGLEEVVKDAIASGYGDTFENTARAVLVALAEKVTE